MSYFTVLVRLALAIQNLMPAVSQVSMDLKKGFESGKKRHYNTIKLSYEIQCPISRF
jgi:hypothetical protein